MTNMFQNTPAAEPLALRSLLQTFNGCHKKVFALPNFLEFDLTFCPLALLQMMYFLLFLTVLLLFFFSVCEQLPQVSFPRLAAGRNCRMFRSFRTCDPDTWKRPSSHLVFGRSTTVGNVEKVFYFPLCEPFYNICNSGQILHSGPLKPVNA